MKYTVHVTLVASIEVEANSQTEAKRIALGECEVLGGNQFDESAVIFETYNDKSQKVRRGVGSY